MFVIIHGETFHIDNDADLQIARDALTEAGHDYARVWRGSGSGDDDSYQDSVRKLFASNAPAHRRGC